MTSMEKAVRPLSTEATSIQDHVELETAELSRLTNLFNEISSGGSQRISHLLGMREEHADEAIKERKRGLKTRYDALVKASSQGRERCSKLLAAWKELGSSVEACGAALRGVENNLEKAAAEGMDEAVDSLNAAIQTASRRNMQTQRLLEVGCCVLKHRLHPRLLLTCSPFLGHRWIPERGGEAAASTTTASRAQPTKRCDSGGGGRSAGGESANEARPRGVERGCAEEAEGVERTAGDLQDLQETCG